MGKYDRVRSWRAVTEKKKKKHPMPVPGELSLLNRACLVSVAVANEVLMRELVTQHGHCMHAQLLSHAQ